mgnify:CR=1 FL=1
MNSTKTNCECPEGNLSKADLLIIHAALNEICNGIDVFEFETRIGATVEQALKLMGRVGRLLDKMNA